MLLGIEYGPRPRPVSGGAPSRARRGRTRAGGRRGDARARSRGDIARAARRGEAANGRERTTRETRVISKRASTETERRDDAMARDPREVTGEVARVVIGGDVFQVNDAVLVKAPGANERYVGRIVSVAVEERGGEGAVVLVLSTARDARGTETVSRGEGVVFERSLRLGEREHDRCEVRGVVAAGVSRARGGDGV